MKTLGRHLLLDYYDCDPDLLDDVERLRAVLLATAALVNATVVGEVFHRYAPHGVSGTVVIAESHLSLHTWPEAGYVAADLFTCGGLDPRPAFEHLARALGAGAGRWQEVVRGLVGDLTGAVLPEDVRVLAQDAELVRFR